MQFATIAVLFTFTSSLFAQSGVAGHVFDPQGKAVTSADVVFDTGGSFSSVKTDDQGRYEFAAAPGDHSVTAKAPGFTPITARFEVAAGDVRQIDLRFKRLSDQHGSIVITSKTLEPALDLRNSEVFNRTLFSRDDQVFQQLDAGINAGQHEGGGKSLEIRRFGFNLDHGGVNGGLKVMVDDVQQNQATQGHGQGYLGSLKALSPELIEGVTLINGPFSAEYGDFSGLGVVQIHQREALPDEFTARFQSGNFNARRTFLAYSPSLPNADAYLAYEGSYTDGPFVAPLQYRRDNVNGNYTKTLQEGAKLCFRVLLGRNRFDSSGQIPLDLVDEARLNRFGYIDPTDGGSVSLGTLSASYSSGSRFRADAFLSRSLFDLFSNFAYYLNDPLRGDAIQQHDSRLQEGGNAQYTLPHRLGGSGILVAGANLHDSGINVGLYPREGRVPYGVLARADARVTNAAGYIQENLGFWDGRLLLGGGLRYDSFRFDVRDLITPAQSGTQWAGRWQGKGSVAFTPARSMPLTTYLNYGRGINSADARAVVQRPDQPRLATTDFYQAGVSSDTKHFSASVDLFLIDHSNEQVYVPDDGTFEFKGPSRAYGYEAKTSVTLTRHLSLNAGLTKIANAFYRGGAERVYVEAAPHFVANAGLTVAAWHGWSGSLSMRAINHYLLDGAAAVVASGHTVWDAGVSKTLRKGIELNLSVDNLTNRDYYETQNYFESRVAPDAPAISRIHGTPGYPLTLTAGLTVRLGRK